MGLDTSHNAWHGPYSSFNEFRDMLAKQIGINLNDYYGYGGTLDLMSIEHDIQPLLNHSDCDGELSVKESEQIAKGLQSILDNWKDLGDWNVYFMEKTRNFLNGCLLAVSKNEIIDFH